LTPLLFGRNLFFFLQSGNPPLPLCGGRVRSTLPWHGVPPFRGGMALLRPTETGTSLSSSCFFPFMSRSTFFSTVRQGFPLPPLRLLSDFFFQRDGEIAAGRPPFSGRDPSSAHRSGAQLSPPQQRDELSRFTLPSSSITYLGLSKPQIFSI